MNFLITGVAGFIGFHLAKLLVKEKNKIVGIDNINSYYDVILKRNRLKKLKEFKNFFFIKSNIEDKNLFKKLKNVKIDCVINLAAQAGVRYSFKDPHSYINSNVLGHLNILEIVKKKCIHKFIYASSSSVYGGNKTIPFSVKDRVDSPLSLYAASKKSCELITECYANLFKINCIGLRFFTVYGPWGRPDMATYIFTKNIIEKKHIDVFNNGKMKRDFTYIDDIVSGILGAIKRKDQNKYHSIYNLGNNNSENLMDFIKIIENELSIKAKINFLPLQQGDVIKTFADIKKSISDLKFRPKTKISEGIPKFVKWYKDYHEFR